MSQNASSHSHILIVGAGLMGPAAAFNALNDPGVGRVTVVDIDEEKLRRVRDWMVVRYMMHHVPTNNPIDRFHTQQHDLSDHDATVSLFGDADVILTALPWRATVLAVRAAIEAGVPLVDLAIPDDSEMALLREETERANGAILLGCGLEPGLTEIEARRLAGMLDEVRSFDIMVGGIPEVPSGPLGYKIVFGGDQLPLRSIPALTLESGERIDRPRYSGKSRTEFAGVGRVEAWHEGIIPWLLDQPEMNGLQDAMQRTIRWPGYAAKARALNELGLLGTEPVQVGNGSVIPKELVDTLLRPHVTMEEGDRDITLFRVEVSGMRGGEPVTLKTEMVDRYDEETGFTSMGRTTAFTGAIFARMIAAGEITFSGLRTPDELITGQLYHRMIEELAKENIRFRTDEYSGEVRKFMHKEGRLKVLPSKRSKRDLVLHYLATYFDPEVEYSENEVNRTLNGLHNFNDVAWLRRELVDGGWFKRETNGERYRRIR
ncbi:MAG: saccharopine dehydrogenase C-terminal domain-containing protein [Candidatus Kapaibacterium sp.]